MLKILLIQLKGGKQICLDTNSSTLDEATKQLPLGYYTTFRTYAAGTQVAGLRAHLQRLYGPAEENGIQPNLSMDELRKSLFRITTNNSPNESHLRIIMSKHEPPGLFYVAIHQFTPPPEEVYFKGVNTRVMSLTRQKALLKSTEFIQASHDARRLIRENKDVYEILIGHHRHILEGITSNFFAIVDGTIITACDQILLGVTRKIVLKIACADGIPIEYHPPCLDIDFDEAFITSSTRGVIPVVSIGEKIIGKRAVGIITRHLQKRYDAHIEDYLEAIQ